MGGSGITIAETTNYEWVLWDYSGDDHHYYPLKLRRKSDNADIDIPRSGWGSESEQSPECDKAYDELEIEFKHNHYHKEMTEEQTTLANMYERMTKAERNYEYVRKKYGDAMEILARMNAAQIEYEKTKTVVI